MNHDIPVNHDALAVAETGQAPGTANEVGVNVDDSGNVPQENPIFDEEVIDEPAIEGFVGPVINLEATLSIQHVVKLHGQLKKAYMANDAIEINASQVSSIDTANLQLLVALKKSAAKQQKEVVFVDPSTRFIESAGLLGLLEVLDIDA